MRFDGWITFLQLCNNTVCRQMHILNLNLEGSQVMFQNVFET